MKIIRSTRERRSSIQTAEVILSEDPKIPLFHSGPPLRRIRVILDMDCAWLRNHQNEDQRLALLGLLRQQAIRYHMYCDAGPPHGLQTLKHGKTDVTEDWIHLAPARDHFLYADKTAIKAVGFGLDNIREFVEHDEQTEAYRDLPAPEAAKRRLSDITVLQIADGYDADLLISDRAYLHANGPAFVKNRPVEILHPSDALAVIGLYLRTQGSYIGYAVGPVKLSFNRGLMLWVAARALLPQGWRWMNACGQNDQYTGRDDMIHYAASMHQRIERAIRARDELFVALNQPQNNDTADDALIALDNILISLSAALDVVARVMNEAIGSNMPARRVGWRSRDWIRELRSRRPDVATALVDDLAFSSLLTIVGTLRNTVHGAALQPLAISQGSLNRTDTLFGLPSDQLDELLDAMDALGGREQWGVSERIHGRAHAELDIVCEQLMTRVPAFINQAMELTPVEDLEGVSLTPSDLLPPEDENSPFRATYRQHVLWQLGLTDRA